MDSNAFMEQFRRELDRLGLDEHTSPYGMIGSGGADALEQFLSHVRSLAVGATWRDVFPEIPAHWDLDDDETWTHPYRPLGVFDYPCPPCGPALLIRMPGGASEADLKQLATDAAGQAWQVYGSGFVPIANADWPDRLAHVVLDVATTDRQFHEFTQWIEQRPGVVLAAYARMVGARFAPDFPTSA